MFKKPVLALAACYSVALAYASAVEIRDDFSSDPLVRGWVISGQTNLFSWNREAEAMEVTWDSSKPNSYFAYPLGAMIGVDDDFGVAFDLRLTSAVAGVNPEKTQIFQLSLAFVNLAGATDSGFLRGTGFNSPDLVEFSYFPDPGGDWQYGPSLYSSMIDSAGGWSKGGFAGVGLETGVTYRVTLQFTSSDRVLRTTLLKDGQPFAGTSDAYFEGESRGFRLDHFVIASYSDAGQSPEFDGSILAHGFVDNVVLTLPPPPVAQITGSLVDGVWKVTVPTRSGWLYSLERSTDLAGWTTASEIVIGQGTPTELSELAVLTARAVFYRVKAAKAP